MEPPLNVLATLLNRPSSALTEKELSLLWSYLVPNLDGLTTLDGRTLSIYDKGRIGNPEGPDVRGAGVELDGVCRRGDVEIHRQSADWYHHGHHRDESYNGTILQVAAAHGESSQVRRADGCWVPTLVLPIDRIEQLRPDDFSRDRSLNRRYRSVKRPCYQPEVDSDSLGAGLEQAGAAWFGYRTARFREGGPGTLFRELCGSLGYTRNHTAFDRLARRLRPEDFQARIRSARPREMEAGLLGLGGWLGRSEEQAPHPEEDEWRSLWKEQFPAWCRFAVDRTSWKRSGVRPQAFPIRRWISFGYLTRRLPAETWGSFVRTDVADWIRTGTFRSRWIRWVEDHGRPPDTSYWRHHYTLTDDPKTTVPRSLGQGWADAVAVNVLLPYLSSTGLVEQGTLNSLRSYPATMENRRLRRLREQFGHPDLPLTSVLQQQGGVFLYKRGCREGACEGCPLNRRGEHEQRSLFPRSR